jgi:hypothetical protein
MVVGLETFSRARGFEKSGARSQESEEESRIAFEYALSNPLMRNKKSLTHFVKQIVSKYLTDPCRFSEPTKWRFGLNCGVEPG